LFIINAQFRVENNQNSTPNCTSDTGVDVVPVIDLMNLNERRHSKVKRERERKKRKKLPSKKRKKEEKYAFRSSAFLDF
jgi:hypothetical protein